jgi:hypothetical protein
MKEISVIHNIFLGKVEAIGPIVSGKNWNLIDGAVPHPTTYTSGGVTSTKHIMEYVLALELHHKILRKLS